MAGGSKNNPTNKGTSSKVNLVLSDACETCKVQCSRGKQYIDKIKTGKPGNGIVCKK